jgi:tetratricopeptide (TPR) repeat protein
LQGRFDEAQEVLDLLPDDEDEEVRIRTMLERGRVLNSSGEPAAARPMFDAAFEAATTAGFDHLAIDALHMVAIAAPADVQDALNERALELGSSSNDPRARQWRASLLNNMGWTAFDRGDYEDALRLFEQALAAREQQGRQPGILIARWSVARTLRALGRVDEALAIQLELSTAHHAAGSTDANVDEEIAACRAALGETA